MSGSRLVSLLVLACVFILFWDSAPSRKESPTNALNVGTDSTILSAPATQWHQIAIARNAWTSHPELNKSVRTNPFGAEAAPVTAVREATAPNGWKCVGSIQGRAGTVQSPSGERRVVKPGDTLEGFQVVSIGTRTVTLQKGRTTWTIGG